MGDPIKELKKGLGKKQKVAKKPKKAKVHRKETTPAASEISKIKKYKARESYKDIAKKPGTPHEDVNHGKYSTKDWVKWGDKFVDGSKPQPHQKSGETLDMALKGGASSKVTSATNKIATYAMFAVVFVAVVWFVGMKFTGEQYAGKAIDFGDEEEIFEPFIMLNYPSQGEIITTESFILDFETEFEAECTYKVIDEEFNVVIDGPLYGKLEHLEKIDIMDLEENKGYTITVYCGTEDGNRDELSVEFMTQHGQTKGSTEQIRQMVEEASLKFASFVTGNTNNCVMVPYRNTLYSYDIAKQGESLIVVSADSLYCDGALNEDFILQWKTNEAFNSFAVNPGIDKFREGKGLAYDVQISKFIPNQGTLLCNEEFSEKFCDTVNTFASDSEKSFIKCCR